MRLLSTLGLAIILAGATAIAQSATTTIPATGGDITITAIQHASVQVEHAGKVIQIDPAQGDFSKAKQGDLVLITDIHGDHLNPDLVAKVRKAGVPVVMPAAVKSDAAGAKIPAPIEVLAKNTKSSVMLQLDVGTCLKAGSDPAAWIRANPGRIRSLHLKDWSSDPAKGYKVLFGEGDADWKKIFAAAESVGGVEYYLLEQEGSRFGEVETARRCLQSFRAAHA